MEERIAKAESAEVGIEGHGILTISVNLAYDSSSKQGIPLFNCQSEKGGEFIKAILEIFGVDRVSQIKGRHIMALTENGAIVGLAKLPTEGTGRLIFSDLMSG